MFAPCQAHVLQGTINLGATGRLAGKACGDKEIFLRAEFFLQAIGIADIDQIPTVVLAPRPDRFAAPAYFASHGVGQPTQRAQQRGLAAAVAALDPDQSARFEDERHVSKQATLTARTTQSDYFQHK